MAQSKINKEAEVVNEKTNPNLGATLKNWFNTNAAGKWIKANPGRTAGLGILGAGNLAGLFDNNRIGGQLIGAGLGTGASFLPELLGAAAFRPSTKVLMGMGGGAIGSLFDALLDNQDQQRKEEQELERMKYAAMMSQNK